MQIQHGNVQYFLKLLYVHTASSENSFDLIQNNLLYIYKFHIVAFINSYLSSFQNNNNIYFFFH